MVASKLDFRGKAKFWVNWAVRNQQNPEMYPLIPNQDIEESQLHEDTYRGLHEVIPHKVETRIPRLPWGSQKALIINLESSIELSRAQEESNTIQQLMESRGIDTTVVCAREDDDPKNLLLHVAVLDLHDLLSSMLAKVEIPRLKLTLRE
jgi:hypothetical protein